MIDRAPHGRSLSVDEYLHAEADALIRHEYVAGEAFAMAGGSLRHNAIALNIATRLRSAASGGACRVFISDVKLRAASDVFYYPDVVVTCTAAADTDVFLRHPCLIVEVTSPGTAATDRREKLVAYRQISGLRAYLIVDQGRRRVDVHARAADVDEWSHRVCTGDEAIDLNCPPGRLALDEIYEGVSPLALGEDEAPVYEA